MPDDVLQDAIVGGGLAPLIVLRLQAVYRDVHLHARDRRPFDRNRPDRTGDDLRINAALGEPRQDVVELSKPDQRFAADDRDMDGPMRVDQLQEAIDELLALVVADLAQCDATAEVFVAVCVTTWTAERALAGDFNGERWTVPLQYPSPSSKNAFHGPTISPGPLNSRLRLMGKCLSGSDLGPLQLAWGEPGWFNGSAPITQVERPHSRSSRL